MFKLLNKWGKAVNAKFPILPEDKVMHFTLSLFIGIILALVTLLTPMFSFFEAFLAAMIPGFYKEYKDAHTPGNKWSWGDLVADAVGAAAGVAAVAYAVFLM
jgi:VanZ family protein